MCPNPSSAAPPPERRRHPRTVCTLTAALQAGTGPWEIVRILNLSARGAAAAVPYDLPPGSAVQLLLPEGAGRMLVIGGVSAHATDAHGGRVVGCRFRRELTPAELRRVLN
jgi:hypothetical protein